MMLPNLFALALLAQEPIPTATQGWVSLIVQTGAIGILGYHLLFSLPKMAQEQAASLERMTKSLSDAFERQTGALIQLFRNTLAEDRKNDQDRTIEERRAFSERNQAVVGELTRLRDLPAQVGGKIDAMVDELKHQTGTLDITAVNVERQTKVLEGVAQKLEEWPSDAGKVCKAAEALKTIGFDDKTIARLMEVRKRRAEREHKRGE